MGSVMRVVGVEGNNPGLNIRNWRKRPLVLANLMKQILLLSQNYICESRFNATNKVRLSFWTRN
jgi:hypothetical protein